MKVLRNKKYTEKKTKREDYSSPQLKRFGNMSRMTKGSSGSQTDGAGSLQFGNHNGGGGPL